MHMSHRWHSSLCKIASVSPSLKKTAWHVRGVTCVRLPPMYNSSRVTLHEGTWGMDSLCSEMTARPSKQSWGTWELINIGQKHKWYISDSLILWDASEEAANIHQRVATVLEKRESMNQAPFSSYGGRTSDTANSVLHLHVDAHSIGSRDTQKNYTKGRVIWRELSAHPWRTGVSYLPWKETIKKRQVWGWGISGLT